MKTKNVSNSRRLAVFLSIALLGSVVFLTGCADTVGFTDAVSREPVGFWYGLWHGIIAPIAWLVSLFDDDVAIYAIYNNGGWYDFGFMLGIGALGSASKR